MRCEICNQNEAAISMQILTNEQMIQKTICLRCAQKMHRDFLQNIVSFGENKQKEVESTELPKEEQTAFPEALCLNCGRRIDLIGEDTVFGCPSCYEAAKTRLISFLQNIHADETGIQTTQPVLEQTELDGISHALREAIACEDYEKAAVLYRQICEMTCEDAHGKR